MGLRKTIDSKGKFPLVCCNTYSGTQTPRGTKTRIFRATNVQTTRHDTTATLPPPHNYHERVVLGRGSVHEHNCLRVHRNDSMTNYWHCDSIQNHILVTLLRPVPLRLPSHTYSYFLNRTLPCYYWTKQRERSRTVYWSPVDKNKSGNIIICVFLSMSTLTYVSIKT